MAEQNLKWGVAAMVGSTIVFATQDVLSRHLAGEYNVLMVVMIRYWAFAAFVMALSARAPGGLRAAVRTGRPGLQIARGLILVVEICIMTQSFVYLGLIPSIAVFIVHPLIVAALSGPILGERVGWRRWLAIATGFVGVLIILKPGFGVFSLLALIPLAGAVLFAVYGILTRLAAKRDSSAVSFFWTGMAGMVGMTTVGIWFWEPMARADWGWMAVLCCTAMLGHWLLIKAYDLAEASAVQPFAYLQLVFSASLAVTFLGEVLEWNVITGAALVVGAGLFSLWRERVRARERLRAAG
jgi:drug/metabolite transporter (DMT)-like permease